MEKSPSQPAGQVRPDLVMRCYGITCGRKPACARYVALQLDARRDVRAPLNLCEASGRDCFIPILPRSREDAHRPAAGCADPAAPVCAATNTEGSV